MDLLKEKNRKSILVQTENRVNDRDLKEIISQILTVLLGEEDNAIEISTRLLLEYFDADQVYIALFDDKQEKIFFLQKSLSDLDATTLTDLKELPYEEVPWTVQCIKQKIDIVCDDLSQLPPEADIDRRLLVEKQKLKSMLVLPLVLQDKAQGAIGFDFSRNTHYWTEKEISDLRIIVRALAI
ncbi:GAF domain-containing protein, partial [uncultured Parabacteroides sp.]|uniref:GAF domain-containing protein n=1 Tax=uncultured Parabacteroides sp. TaxID=512312 RepID=UPI002607C16F